MGEGGDEEEDVEEDTKDWMIDKKSFRARGEGELGPTSWGFLSLRSSLDSAFSLDPSFDPSLGPSTLGIISQLHLSRSVGGPIATVCAH